MRLVSWNVNGLRAALKKGFIESMRELDPDIIGIQETKMQPGQAEVDLPEYEEYFNSAIRKGYSGTAVFSKHKPINPKTNRRNAGFTDEERDKFGKLLDAGFTDTFRHLYPDQEGIYSWWSYRFNARKNNAGWRIDYFLVSDRIADRIKEAKIHTDIMGSDHCPVSLEIDI